MNHISGPDTTLDRVHYGKCTGTVMHRKQEILVITVTYSFGDQTSSRPVYIRIY
jgi:hypothetical protein